MKSATYRGLLIGSPASTLGIVSEDGLDGFESEATVTGAGHYHGGSPAGGYVGDREFTMTMRTRARKGDPTALLRAAKAVFQPTGETEYPFDYIDDDGSPLRVYARVVARSAPKDKSNRRVGRDLTVRFLASDPRIYGQAEKEGTGGIFSTIDGETWPTRAWGDPWSTGTTGAITIAVGGQFTTWPIFEIRPGVGGALIDPVIEHINGPGRLRFNQDGGLVVNVGQVFIVDTKPQTRSVAFEGGGDRWNTLSPDSVLDDFELAPQTTHEFRFRSLGVTTGSTLRVRLRDAEI